MVKVLPWWLRWKFRVIELQSIASKTKRKLWDTEHLINLRKGKKEEKNEETKEDN